MTIDNINIEATLKKAEELLKEEKGLSLAMKSMVGLLLLVITLLVKRLNLTSNNSSKPPSQDQNRAKKERRGV